MFQVKHRSHINKERELSEQHIELDKHHMKTVRQRPHYLELEMTAVFLAQDFHYCSVIKSAKHSTMMCISVLVIRRTFPNKSTKLLQLVILIKQFPLINVSFPHQLQPTIMMFIKNEGKLDCRSNTERDCLKGPLFVAVTAQSPVMI